MFLYLQGLVLIGSVPLGAFLYLPGMLRYEPLLDASEDWAAMSLLSLAFNAAVAALALAISLGLDRFRRAGPPAASSPTAPMWALALLGVLVVLPYEEYFARRLHPYALAHPAFSTALDVLSTDAGGLLLAVPFVAAAAYAVARSGQGGQILRRLRTLGLAMTSTALIAVPLVVFARASAPSGAAGGSPAMPPTGKAPNVILLTLDAMSANAMSLYGAALPTTPMLDKFARRGVVIDRVISASNFTTPGLSTLLSGLDVNEHGNNELGSYFVAHPGSDPRDFLPARLKASGYDVAAVVANLGGYPPRLRIGRSFDHYELSSSTCDPVNGAIARVEDFNMAFSPVMFPHMAAALGVLNLALCDWRSTTSAPAEDAYARALHWLDDVHDGRRPAFLWVHTFQPHAPYAPPPPHRQYFNKSSRWTGLFPFADGEIPAYVPAKAGSPDMRLLAQRYAENVRYADAALADFLQQIERRGLLRNSIVIVTSDHGETFDRWVTHDGPFLNQDLIGVPFVVMGPGIPAATRLHGFAAQRDIAPTILDLAGVPIPRAMTGHSLRPWIAGTGPAPNWPIYSMRIQKSRWVGPIRGGTFALIENNMKYVQYFDAGREELYDLTRDPREAHDLSQLDPDLLARMRRELDDHLAPRKAAYQPHAS